MKTKKQIRAIARARFVPAPTVQPQEQGNWIPREWTFDAAGVALRFDRHVREQLPWYDQLLGCIAHIGANYIPREGMVYDIGASTGNVGRALGETIVQRGADLVAIEKSPDMAKHWLAPSCGHPEVPYLNANLELKDAMTYEFEPYDLAVVNLVLMFMPVEKRAAFVDKLCAKAKPGAAVIFVEKVVAPSGYLGTVFRRMPMRWKLRAGASPDEILEKELSLTGIQRPIDPVILPEGVQEFFRFGEFAGWVWEAPETANFHSIKWAEAKI